MNQVRYKCHGQNSKSSYLLVDGRTKSFTSTLVKNLSPTYGGTMNQATHGRLVKNISLLPTGGWTNQATYECLGKKTSSFYLWEDRRTKPLASALVKKFKSYLLVER